MARLTDYAPWDLADARQRINLSWLIRLRWGATAGQFLAVIAAISLLHIPLPVWPLLGVIAATASSNSVLLGWANHTRRVPETLVGGIIALDVLLLTALLYFTGGSSNPFNFLYLIHIALAAVILRARWMVPLVVLALGSFVALFWLYVPLPVAGGTHPHGMPPDLYAQGTVVSFALAATFIVYFVQRVTVELRAKESELAAAREASARTERLTALATLAAGAAHELATPLATIAVVAKELERSLRRQSDSSASEDARLIRQEVERCRTVLTQMAADAGASDGESFVATQAVALVQEALEALPGRHGVRLHVQQEAHNATLWVPQRSMVRVLRDVIKNALEASEPALPVEVDVQADATACRVVVRDRGQGMSADILARVSEPFFTTKPPGAGMGLGLFLARTLLERLGGGIELASTHQQGTTVTLRLPTLPKGEK